MGNDKLAAQIDELRREVQSLRKNRDPARFARSVRNVFSSSPKLEVLIKTWIRASPHKDALPEGETAALIANVIRRVSRVSLIGAVLAILPVFFLAWQNIITQNQLAEARTQNIELVRHQRKSDMRALLLEAETAMFAIIKESGGLPQLTTSDFLSKCRVANTPENILAKRLLIAAFPYVRYLSELYLLDTLVLEPLSERLSETRVATRGAATSPEVYWRAYKTRPVMKVLEHCHTEPQTGSYALTRLVLWSAMINEDEYLRFSQKATEVKYKYDIAKRQIQLDAELRPEGSQIFVTLLNRAQHPFEDVMLTCLVSARQRDIHRISHNIANLNQGLHTLILDLPESTNMTYKDAKLLCRVPTATPINYSLSTRS